MTNETLPDSSQMKDILDIEGIRYFPWMDVFKLAGAVLVVVVLIAGVYGLWRLIRYLIARWKESKRTPPERALAALKLLGGRDWPEKNEMRLYYFELSGIARLYVQEQFAYQATDKTSEEMKRELPGVQTLDPSHVALVLEIIKRADLAKFAAGRPEASLARADLSRVEEFVKATALQPKESAVPGKAAQGDR